MWALITGGSSGIGYEMARKLLSLGYDVKIVSRTAKDIDQLAMDYQERIVLFVSYDLTREEECYRLLKETENEDYDIFINNAGFGDIGHIDKTNTIKEINMIKVNDIATLILTKEFINRFIKKDKGNILMVASAAAFGVAPYMSCYYASKAFVYSLAHGYYRELKDLHSHVNLSVLCPGPVNTNFQKVANAKFAVGGKDPRYIADYAIDKMLKGKFEIVPSIEIKFSHLFSHLVPKRLISAMLRKGAQIVEPTESGN